MNTLIRPEELSLLLDEQPLILDCRFDFSDTGRGARDHAAGHIPGAVYAHLDDDLSGRPGKDLGRHPLPQSQAFAKSLSGWGWNGRSPVIAYDDGSGAIAARAWWLLLMAGHSQAAVLNGGWASWQSARLPVSSVAGSGGSGSVSLNLDTSRVIYAEELQHLLEQADTVLLDARAAERYRGEVEPIDLRAGHVPGACNRPFTENLQPNGQFKRRAQLREEFLQLLDQHAAHKVVHMCGSGITACHNLLAMEHAGLSGSRLFAPSWSGWISGPSRPIQTK